MMSFSRSFKLAIPTLLAAIAATACTSVSSENVTTQGIHADIRVVADGGGTTEVRVQLEVGSGGIGGTQLDLSPGDSLTATANGVQRTLAKDSSLFGDIEYFATFPFDDAETNFVVALRRNNGTNAPNSNVRLPAGFLIQSPTTATTYARNDNIAIVWAPSGTSVTPSAFVTIECTLTSGLFIIGAQSVSLSSDTGAASIPVSSALPTSSAIDPTRLCEGTVYLERSRRGSLDANYGEGGQITAEHHQEGRFFVDPAT